MLYPAYMISSLGCLSQKIGRAAHPSRIRYIGSLKYLLAYA